MKFFYKIFLIYILFKTFKNQESISNIISKYLKIDNYNFYNNDITNDIDDTSKLFHFPELLQTILVNIANDLSQDINFSQCLRNIQTNYSNSSNIGLKKLYEGSSKGFIDLGSFYNCFDQKEISKSNYSFYTMYPSLTHGLKINISTFNETLSFEHNWIFGFCIINDLCSEDLLKHIIIAVNKKFRDYNINVLDVYYDLPEHINIINNVNYYKERVEMTPRNMSRLIPMLLIIIQILFLIFKIIPVKLFGCCIKRRYIRENNSDPKKIGFLLNKAIFTKKIKSKIRECFSFADNFDDLINNKKYREEDLTYIKGIKAIGIICIVFGTVFILFFNYPICISEPSQKIEFIKSHSSLILINLWRIAPALLLSASGYSLSYKFLNFLDKKLANMAIENIENNKFDEEEKKDPEETNNILENNEKTNDISSDGKSSNQSSSGKNMAVNYDKKLFKDKEKDNSCIDESKSKSYLENTIGIKFYQNDLTKKQLNSMFKNQKVNDILIISKIPTSKIPVSYYFNFLFRQFHKILCLNIGLHFFEQFLPIYISYNNPGAPLMNYFFKEIIDKIEVGFGNFFFYKNFIEFYKIKDQKDIHDEKNISLLKICSLIVCEFNFFIIGTVLIFICYKKKLALDYIILLLIIFLLIFKATHFYVIELNNPGMIYIDSVYQNFYYNPIFNFDYYLIGMLYGITNYIVQNDISKNESFMKERPWLNIPIFLSKACDYNKKRNKFHYIFSFIFFIFFAIIYPVLFRFYFDEIIEKNNPSIFFKLISSIDVSFFLYIFHFFTLASYITGRNIFFQILDSNVWLQLSKLYFWIVLLTPIFSYYVIYKTETQLNISTVFIFIYGAICGLNIYIISVLFFVILELPYKKLIKLYYNISNRINSEEEDNDEEDNEKYPIQKESHLVELNEKDLEKENNNEEGKEDDEENDEDDKENDEDDKENK